MTEKKTIETIEKIERAMNNVDSFLFEAETQAREVMDADLEDENMDDFRDAQLIREMIHDLYGLSDEVYSVLASWKERHGIE